MCGVGNERHTRGNEHSCLTSLSVRNTDEPRGEGSHTTPKSEDHQAHSGFP